MKSSADKVRIVERQFSLGELSVFVNAMVMASQFYSTELVLCSVQGHIVITDFGISDVGKLHPTMILSQYWQSQFSYLIFQ